MSEYGVIFDLDGVLVDSYRPHLQSWVDVAREYGKELTEAQFAVTFGKTSREVIAEYWGDGLSAAEATAIDVRKEELYRDSIRNDFPAMPGAVDLIRSLVSAGVRLGVGSSAPPENVALTLEGLGCTDVFEAIVTGRDVTRGKPDPQVFRMGGEKLGLPPSRCAVVEDAPPGVEAAVGAGMLSIALLGTATRDALCRADHVVERLGELSPAVIAGWVEEKCQRSGV